MGAMMALTSLARLSPGSFLVGCSMLPSPLPLWLLEKKRRRKEASPSSIPPIFHLGRPLYLSFRIPNCIDFSNSTTKQNIRAPSLPHLSLRIRNWQKGTSSLPKVHLCHPPFFLHSVHSRPFSFSWSEERRRAPSCHDERERDGRRGRKGEGRGGTPSAAAGPNRRKKRRASTRCFSRTGEGKHSPNPCLDVKSKLGKSYHENKRPKVSQYEHGGRIPPLPLDEKWAGREEGKGK